MARDSMIKISHISGIDDDFMTLQKPDIKTTSDQENYL